MVGIEVDKISGWMGGGRVDGWWEGGWVVVGGGRVGG